MFKLKKLDNNLTFALATALQSRQEFLLREETVASELCFLINFAT